MRINSNTSERLTVSIVDTRTGLIQHSDRHRRSKQVDFIVDVIIRYLELFLIAYQLPHQNFVVNHVFVRPLKKTNSLLSCYEMNGSE